MRIYEQMRLRDPDFFVHCGDTIYADGPMTPTVNVEGGRVWNNLIAEGVQKVAETQDEYRGRYRYNLRDANIRPVRPRLSLNTRRCAPTRLTKASACIASSAMARCSKFS